MHVFSTALGNHYRVLEPRSFTALRWLQGTPQIDLGPLISIPSYNARTLTITPEAREGYKAPRTHGYVCYDIFPWSYLTSAPDMP